MNEKEEENQKTLVKKSLLSVGGMNFLIYCVKESFVLVTLRRFHNQRCVRLIETLERVKRQGITEGNGDTHSFNSYTACVHTLLSTHVFAETRRDPQ